MVAVNGTLKRCILNQNSRGNVMNEPKTLERVLETDFNVDVATDYESLKRFLRHPNFPEREKEFKQQLADAIVNRTLSPKEVTDLTDADYETQEEVNELLIKEIWQPLYDDEPIKSNQQIKE